MADSGFFRQPTSRIEELTLQLEAATARAQLCDSTDSPEYQRCIEDVQDLLNQVSKVVAETWLDILRRERVN